MSLPVPPGEWVEFASRGWCEEANRYLQEQAELHPEALDGVEWSVTERWQNAPPHLGFADNIAGFWFTISSGRIEVGAGPASEAETEIDGDYNAILPIGWTIYGGDHNVQTRAQREYGRLSRNKPVAMTGEFPSHPPLLPFLGGLHDHMARRTINNPDVEHRIEHYGLRAIVEELERAGSVVLANAFTNEMAEELQATAGVGRHWEEMVVHPWMLTMVDQAFGAGAVVVDPDDESIVEDALSAVWVLADDDAAGLTAGDIVVSTGKPAPAASASTLRLTYTRSGRPIELDDEVIQRNPPVLWSLCGLADRSSYH